jgi:hypothetical protein
MPQLLLVGEKEEAEDTGGGGRREVLDTREVHTREVHTREVHTREVHTREVHTREVHTITAVNWRRNVSSVSWRGMEGLLALLRKLSGQG